MNNKDFWDSVNAIIADSHPKVFRIWMNMRNNLCDIRINTPELCCGGVRELTTEVRFREYSFR